MDMFQSADLHPYALHHLQSTHVCDESNCSSLQNVVKENESCYETITMPLPLPLPENMVTNSDLKVPMEYTDNSGCVKEEMQSELNQWLEHIKREDDFKNEDSFAEDGEEDFLGSSYNSIGIKQLLPDKNVMESSEFSCEFTLTDIKADDDGTNILGFDLVKLTTEQQLLELAKRRQSTRFKNSKYKCMKCAHTYASQNNLSKHVKSCHCASLGPLVCEICQHRFASNAPLSRHSYVEHARRWRCHRCHALVVSEQFPKHGLNCSADPTYQCNVCTKKYKTNKLLKRHKFTIHESSGVTCDICKKKLKHKEQLPNHMRIHTGEKPYECDVCGIKYGSLGVLYRHKQLKHAPPPDEPLEERYCVECDKHFATKQSFAKHLTQSRIHISQDFFRYACEFCTKKFPLPFLREQHVKSRHSDTRDYTCPHCDKAFALRHALYSHVKNIHRKGEKPRDFVCNMCGAGFMQKKTLAEHRTAVHEKLRPYKCEICQDTFGFSGTLHKHMTLKHKGKKIKRQSNPSTSHAE